MFGKAGLLKRALRIWFPIAVASSFICGLFYLTLQQNYRLSANDPQIQLSEDTAYDLENGTEVNVFSSSNVIVDIASSLSPFITIYDDTGKPTATTGQLNGQSPQLPHGVFDYVRQQRQTRITWQPQSGIRDAIVVTRFEKNDQKGFVMAGRSLREVEKRVQTLGLMIFGGWTATLLTTFIASLLFATL